MILRAPQAADGAAAIPLSGDLVLVGAGKMGTAMLEGWVGLGLDPARVTVLEPSPTPAIAALRERGLRLNPGAGGRQAADVVVLAVKPQVAPDLLPGLARFVGPRSLVVSIMAGRRLDFLGAGLPPDTAIVRAMPNTPAAVGRGMTVAVPNAHVTPSQREAADALLATTGALEWVEDEGLLDAVTAVSGSGPAYVFLLAESLARAGEAAGLPAALAARLASETVAGAGELLHRSADPPARLRENVTSPGGTTAAALAILMGPDGLDALVKRAVEAATQRSRDLGR